MWLEASARLGLSQIQLPVANPFTNKIIADVPIFLIVLIQRQEMMKRPHNYSSFFFNLTYTAIHWCFIIFQTAARHQIPS